MRFSDTTQFQIPQPTKDANSDSSPFNSEESLSEEDSQTFVAHHHLVHPIRIHHL